MSQDGGSRSAVPRSILRSSSMTDMQWQCSASDDLMGSDESRAGSSGGSVGGESSDEEGRRWSTPSLRVVRRSVSWCDVAGRGELEAVLSIERRPKRPSFFSQSLSIIKDEFLFSFRGAMSRDGAMLEAVPPDAATACADSEAERALFEARANTVLNVERVRAMAESLP